MSANSTSAPLPVGLVIMERAPGDRRLCDRRLALWLVALSFVGLVAAPDFGSRRHRWWKPARSTSQHEGVGEPLAAPRHHLSSGINGNDKVPRAAGMWSNSTDALITLAQVSKSKSEEKSATKIIFLPGPWWLPRNVYLPPSVSVRQQAWLSEATKASSSVKSEVKGPGGTSDSRELVDCYLPRNGRIVDRPITTTTDGTGDLSGLTFVANTNSSNASTTCQPCSPLTLDAIAVCVDGCVCSLPACLVVGNRCVRNPFDAHSEASHAGKMREATGESVKHDAAVSTPITDLRCVSAFYLDPTNVTAVSRFTIKPPSRRPTRRLHSVSNGDPNSDDSATAQRTRLSLNSMPYRSTDALPQADDLDPLTTFQRATAWAFDDWYDWRSPNVTCASTGFLPKVLPSESVPDDPRFRSVRYVASHDDQGDYVITNGCLSQAGGLWGYEPSVGQYNGRDEVAGSLSDDHRNVNHDHFVSRVRPLRDPPSCIVEGAHVILMMLDARTSNYGHAFERFVSLFLLRRYVFPASLSVPLGQRRPVVIGFVLLLDFLYEFSNAMRYFHPVMGDGWFAVKASAGDFPKHYLRRAHVPPLQPPVIGPMLCFDKMYVSFNCANNDACEKPMKLTQSGRRYHRVFQDRYRSPEDQVAQRLVRAHVAACLGITPRPWANQDFSQTSDNREDATSCPLEPTYRDAISHEPRDHVVDTSAVDEIGAAAFGRRPPSIVLFDYRLRTRVFPRISGSLLSLAEGILRPNGRAASAARHHDHPPRTLFVTVAVDKDSLRMTPNEELALHLNADALIGYAGTNLQYMSIMPPGAVLVVLHHTGRCGAHHRVLGALSCDFEGNAVSARVVSSTVHIHRDEKLNEHTMGGELTVDLAPKVAYHTLCLMDHAGGCLATWSADEQGLLTDASVQAANKPVTKHCQW